MTLRQSDYRDPAIIIEERERRTCKGCKHRAQLWGMDHCEKVDSDGVKRWKRQGGRGGIRRCADYVEG